MVSNARLSHAQKLTNEKNAKEAAERELAKVKEELIKMQKAVAEGRGQEALMQQQLEAERQARVEHLATVGLRRIMQQGLAPAAGRRGTINMRRTAATATSSPTRPHGCRSRSSLQASCIGKRIGRAEMLLRASKSRQQIAEEEAAEAASARIKLQKENDALKKELADARQAMIEGRGEEAERERRMQEKLEEERQKRVEALANQSLKRLFQLGLARGYTAWKDKWLDYQRKKQLLAQSAHRLSKPKLAQALSSGRMIGSRT